MKNNLLKLTGYVFLAFIVIIFTAGYNSEKIQEALLPKVNTFRAYSLDKVQVTVPFEGVIDVRSKEVIRFYHELDLKEWFVRPGESVVKNQPLFRIKNIEDVLSIEEEKIRLEIELGLLHQKHKDLKATSFETSKLRLKQLDLDLLRDKLSINESINYDNQSEIKSLNTQISQLEYEILLDMQTSKNNQLEDNHMTDQVELELDYLVKEIDDLEKKYAFYGHISSEGIYYASHAGIVSDIVGQGLYASDTPILTINLVSGDAPFVYMAEFDEKYAYLIQKNNLILLDYAENESPVSIKINKVYDAVNGKLSVEAYIDQDINLKLGQYVEGRSIQTPGSRTNIPKTSIISKGEIKNNIKVEFYCVLYEEGLLGNTAKIIKSYGSVAYVGDDYIGLSDKTLPDSFTYVIVDNPQPTLKSGDRISE